MPPHVGHISVRCPSWLRFQVFNVTLVRPDKGKPHGYTARADKRLQDQLDRTDTALKLAKQENPAHLSHTSHTPRTLRTPRTPLAHPSHTPPTLAHTSHTPRTHSHTPRTHLAHTSPTPPTHLARTSLAPPPRLAYVPPRRAASCGRGWSGGRSSTWGWRRSSTSSRARCRGRWLIIQRARGC